MSFILQSFFDDVVLESDRDKNNIIKDIEELLNEKTVLEKVSFDTTAKLYLLVNILYIHLGIANAYFN